MYQVYPGPGSPLHFTVSTQSQDVLFQMSKPQSSPFDLNTVFGDTYPALVRSGCNGLVNATLIVNDVPVAFFDGYYYGTTSGGNFPFVCAIIIIISGSNSRLVEVFSKSVFKYYTWSQCNSMPYGMYSTLSHCHTLASLQSANCKPLTQQQAHKKPTTSPQQVHNKPTTSPQQAHKKPTSSQQAHNKLTASPQQVAGPQQNLLPKKPCVALHAQPANIKPTTWPATTIHGQFLDPPHATHSF